MKIINNLLYAKSTRTNNEFKSLKSLNANNLYESGWVQSVAGRQEGIYKFISGKVIKIKFKWKLFKIF